MLGPEVETELQDPVAAGDRPKPAASDVCVIGETEQGPVLEPQLGLCPDLPGEPLLDLGQREWTTDEGRDPGISPQRDGEVTVSALTRC